jgi:hypothetical protein
MSRHAFAHDIQDLKNALAERAEEVAAWLYPEGKRKSQHWVVGSIYGEPGESFRVNLSGPWAGLAKDWAEGDAKPCSLIDCFMARAGCSFQQAVKDLSSLVGLSRNTFHAPRFHEPKKPKVEPFNPVPMPEDVKELWGRGIMLARTQTKRFAQELAEMRGWPVWSCAKLLSEGVLAPLALNGKTSWAFPVKAPKPGREELETIGLHIFHGLGPDGIKRWEYKPRCKSFPFLIGNPFKAKTWIITEGQWDALSVMIALTPQNPHTILEGVAVVGMRGAGGTGPFLEHYGPFLRGGKCILLPDGDKAGSAWLKPDGLGQKIEGIGARVFAFAQPGGAKDANDALRVRALMREQCLYWITYDGTEGWK